MPARPQESSRPRQAKARRGRHKPNRSTPNILRAGLQGFTRADRMLSYTGRPPGAAKRSGLGSYFDFSNCEPPHQALAYQTPQAVYLGLAGRSEQFCACMSDKKEEDNNIQQAAGGGGPPPWKIVPFCPILAG